MEGTSGFHSVQLNAETNSISIQYDHVQTMRPLEDRVHAPAYYSFIAFIFTWIIISISITFTEYIGLLPRNIWTRPFNLGKNWETLTNTVDHPKAVTSIGKVYYYNH